MTDGFVYLDDYSKTRQPEYKFPVYSCTACGSHEIRFTESSNNRCSHCFGPMTLVGWSHQKGNL